MVDIQAEYLGLGEIGSNEGQMQHAVDYEIADVRR